MIFIETSLGFEYKAPGFLAFFGKKESRIENLKVAYPQYTFKSLHQVHGKDLLKTTFTSEDSRNADAHWTDEKNLALISKTADCLPLLGFDHINKRILSIHAGWRGVQKKIIPTSLQTLGPTWTLFVGPHITKQSFEIQNDCLSLLKECTSLPLSNWYENSHADLLKIVTNQVTGFDITSLALDTVTDTRFHSFRRDKDQAGRQNSFIVLL